MIRQPSVTVITEHLIWYNSLYKERMTSMQTIDTPRLRLREFRESDFQDLYEFLYQLKDDEYDGYPDITSENGRNHLLYRLNNREYYAVVLKENAKVIGNVFCGTRDNNSLQIGFIINKDYQDQGYGSEAVKAVADRMLADGVHRLYSECASDNIKGQHVLENAGFVKEGTLRQYIPYVKPDGSFQWKDVIIYSKLEKDI